MNCLARPAAGAGAGLQRNAGDPGGVLLSAACIVCVIRGGAARRAKSLRRHPRALEMHRTALVGGLGVELRQALDELEAAVDDDELHPLSPRSAGAGS
jgi:hypothetical protein